MWFFVWLRRPGSDRGSGRDCANDSVPDRASAARGWGNSALAASGASPTRAYWHARGEAREPDMLRLLPCVPAPPEERVVVPRGPKMSWQGAPNGGKIATMEDRKLVQPKRSNGIHQLVSGAPCR